jgi:hypothetical protein
LRHQDELEWVREAILKIRDVRAVVRRGSSQKSK